MYDTHKHFLHNELSIFQFLCSNSINYYGVYNTYRIIKLCFDKINAIVMRIDYRFIILYSSA